MKLNELKEGTVSTSMADRRKNKQEQKELAKPTAEDKLNDPEMLALRKKMKKQSRKLKVVEGRDMPDIKFDKTPMGIMAVDANTYDGAEDSGSNIYGQGKNKEAAAADLLDQLVDAGFYSDKILHARYPQF